MNDEASYVQRINAYGLLEKVETKTGDVVSKQLPNKQQRARIEAGKPMIIKKAAMNEYEVWEYSKVVHDKIVELRLRGLSYEEISKVEGMPPAHVVFYWKRKYREFRIDLVNARKDRSEFYLDKVESLANGEYDKNEVPGKRLSLDAFKWLAEKSDRESYGDKKDLVNISGPTQIIVETGIRRGVPDVEIEDRF